MSLNWNTRKFKSIVSKNLCDSLSSVTSGDQLLLVQPNLLPYINRLLTFTQLTESTTVRKIAALDYQLENELGELMRSMPNITIIFLLDLRTDLIIPHCLTNVIQKYKIDISNIVYATWSRQEANCLTEIPHFIKSQLSKVTSVNLTPWHLLPLAELDDNLLSVNVLYNSEGENLYYPKMHTLKNATRAILIDNMVNCLHSVIRQTNSIVTNTVYMGKSSKTLLDLLKDKIDRETDLDDVLIRDALHGNKYDSNLETDLVVIERSMDPVTPLLSQLSYIGILDDIFEFEESNKLKNKDVTFDFINDDIWNDLKFLNFGAIGPSLNKLAKELQTKYDQRHSAETVGEIKNFVDSLGGLQERQNVLKMHTMLSGNILDEVEHNKTLKFNRILELEQDILLGNLNSNHIHQAILDIMYEGDITFEKLVRLVCLFSLCKNSIKDSEYHILLQDIYDHYGIEKSLSIEKLIRNNFISSKTISNISGNIFNKEYRYISNWLNTLPTDEEDTDAQNPTDATFAFCGVVPLSIRYIQLLYDRTILSKFYSAQQPFIISKEPSTVKTSDLFQQIYNDSNIVGSSKWVANPRTIIKNTPTINKKNKVIDTCVVVFLGGITLGELATLKFLQGMLQAKGINKRFTVIADGIINGRRLIAQD